MCSIASYPIRITPACILSVSLNALQPVKLQLFIFNSDPVWAAIAPPPSSVMRLFIKFKLLSVTLYPSKIVKKYLLFLPSIVTPFPLRVMSLVGELFPCNFIASVIVKLPLGFKFITYDFDVPCSFKFSI